MRDLGTVPRKLYFDDKGWAYTHRQGGDTRWCKEDSQLEAWERNDNINSSNGKGDAVWYSFMFNQVSDIITGSTFHVLKIAVPMDGYWIDWHLRGFQAWTTSQDSALDCARALYGTLAKNNLVPVGSKTKKSRRAGRGSAQRLYQSIMCESCCQSAMVGTAVPTLSSSESECFTHQEATAGHRAVAALKSMVKVVRAKGCCSGPGCSMQQ